MRKLGDKQFRNYGSGDGFFNDFYEFSTIEYIEYIVFEFCGMGIELLT